MTFDAKVQGLAAGRHADSALLIVLYRVWRRGLLGKPQALNTKLKVSGPLEPDLQRKCSYARPEDRTPERKPKAQSL